MRVEACLVPWVGEALGQEPQEDVGAPPGQQGQLVPVLVGVRLCVEDDVQPPRLWAVSPGKMEDSVR